MKVILRSDIANVGKRGDICDVADGYARNYLLPKGLAMVATDGAVTQAASMRRARDLRDAQDRRRPRRSPARSCPRSSPSRPRPAAGGRLFGSVTADDIVEAVEAQTGIVLDRRKLHLDEPIKELGTALGAGEAPLRRRVPRDPRGRRQLAGRHRRSTGASQPARRRRVLSGAVRAGSWLADARLSPFGGPGHPPPGLEATRWSGRASCPGSCLPLGYGLLGRAGLGRGPVSPFVHSSGTIHKEFTGLCP